MSARIDEGVENKLFGFSAHGNDLTALRTNCGGSRLLRQPCPGQITAETFGPRRIILDAHAADDRLDGSDEIDDGKIFRDNGLKFLEEGSAFLDVRLHRRRFQQPVHLRIGVVAGI